MLGGRFRRVTVSITATVDTTISEPVTGEKGICILKGMAIHTSKKEKNNEITKGTNSRLYQNPRRYYK